MLNRNKLNNCCGKPPVHYMPMFWGNHQIDPSLRPSISCEVCGREAFGETKAELDANWNGVKMIVVDATPVVLPEGSPPQWMVDAQRNTNREIRISLVEKFRS